MYIYYILYICVYMYLCIYTIQIIWKCNTHAFRAKMQHKCNIRTYRKLPSRQMFWLNPRIADLFALGGPIKWPIKQNIQSYRLGFDKPRISHQGKTRGIIAGGETAQTTDT